jgi:hypothetical protein
MKTKHHHSSTMLFAVTVLALLAATVAVVPANAAFNQSTITPNGVIYVDGRDTYYDGSDGILSTAYAIPLNVTSFQFRVTGDVYTDGPSRPCSGDGLLANGTPPYTWVNTRITGTYQGVPVGATTGIDPALFGVFFSSSFSGTPADSLDFRPPSVSGGPELRTLLDYYPSLNQPFYIGDGYSDNNPFLTTSDSYTPPGSPQTFHVPVGATELILGIGADPMPFSDNGDTLNVHVFDNAPIPEPATFLLLGLGGLAVMRKRR